MNVNWEKYVDRLFEEREKLHRTEIDNAHRALDIAAANLKEKLKEMNNFRLQLERERGSYLQQKDLTSIKDAIRKMEDRNSNIDGRLWALGIGLAFISAILSVLTTVATLRFAG